MTNHRHRPSLLQAGDSPDILLPSSSTSDPHARSAAHPRAHRHTHHAHAHDHAQHHHLSDNRDDNTDPESEPASASASASAPGPDSIIANSHPDERASSEATSLDPRAQAAAVDAALAVRADDTAAYVTQIVQTISVIQVVDISGSPISTQTQYAEPNTVVLDPVSGETISQSEPAATIALDPSNLIPNPGSLLPDPGQILSDLGIQSSSSTSTTTSTLTTTSTSSQPSSAPISASAGFPTLSDASNGTVWGNMTAAGSASNSTLTVNAFTPPSNISATLSNLRIHSSSTLTTTSDDTEPTTSSLSFTLFATPTYNAPPAVPTVVGSAETTPAASAGGVPPLTPQQKQIVGSVVGSVAGVAFLALLVMLVMRYKKKKVNSPLAGGSGARGLGSLPAPGGDATNPMAEKDGAAASVSAAFAALTSKRQSRAAGPPPAGERGFYRVSGRKLPSVLHTGGDGYSDPRESTMSRFSQSSEPFHPGDQHFTLGAPMRPISGMPIMRSGPARTPITEDNPFADPASPPLPLHDSPSGRPGSNSSTRGSRFQESM